LRATPTKLIFFVSVSVHRKSMLY